MKKRLETTTISRSSSMGRDSVSVTKTTQQTTNVGCMSGIFQFVSKYHTRRKFLTFGKKHEQCQSVKHRRSSKEVTLEVQPRSPIIPQEIRLPPPPPPRMPTIREAVMVTEVAEEKRRKLLGALEKCDEDLQELRRIILAVRGVKNPPPKTQGTSPRGGVGKRKEDEEEEEEEEEIRNDEPSPVSVLDHHRLVDRSPSISYAKWTRQGEINQHQHQQQQLIPQNIDRIRPAEKENTGLHFQNTKYTSRTFPVSAKAWPQVYVGSTIPPTSRWSSATRECVIEVCKAGEWGQLREVGNLVLVLQDIIFIDLVDEIINDLDWYHGRSRSLCFEARKRKLLF